MTFLISSRWCNSTSNEGGGEEQRGRGESEKPYLCTRRIHHRCWRIKRTGKSKRLLFFHVSFRFVSIRLEMVFVVSGLNTQLLCQCAAPIISKCHQNCLAKVKCLATGKYLKRYRLVKTFCISTMSHSIYFSLANLFLNNLRETERLRDQVTVRLRVQKEKPFALIVLILRVYAYIHTSVHAVHTHFKSCWWTQWSGEKECLTFNSTQFRLLNEMSNVYEIRCVLMVKLTETFFVAKMQKKKQKTRKKYPKSGYDYQRKSGKEKKSGEAFIQLRAHFSRFYFIVRSECRNIETREVAFRFGNWMYAKIYTYLYTRIKSDKQNEKKKKTPQICIFTMKKKRNKVGEAKKNTRTKEKYKINVERITIATTKCKCCDFFFIRFIGEHICERTATISTKSIT